MIRTTGFKRAFLMPSNRRPPMGTYFPNDVPFSFTGHGWFFHRDRSGRLISIITSHHTYLNPRFDRMIPSQPRYAVEPSTFHRLFLLPWKNK